MAQNLVLDVKLNQDSYNNNNSSGGLVAGWSRLEVGTYKLPVGSNFAAQLYQGADGSYKIAYRGTVNPLGKGDAAINAGIVGGQWTAEMSESVRFTFLAIKQIQSETGFSFDKARSLLTLTGHSQGGFEAELNAKFYGLGGTSIDGPGASPLIGVAGWTAMKEWARAQEPGVQKNYDIGDFMARRYTLLVGGVSPHVAGGGMVVDNATASLLLQTGSLFSTPLGAAASLGVQGGYLHLLDTILALEQARASYPWLQKIVDGNDASDSPLGLAAVVSGQWAQIQIADPGASVSADDVQAILQGFLADRQGQGVVVQEYNKTVYIEASNGDRLILSPDGSGLKVVGQGIATVQTEYAKGGSVLAISGIQGDDAGNILITRRGSNFDSVYTLDTTGQATHVNFKTFDAANQLQAEYFMNRNADGSTTVQVYDGSAQLQSTSNTQTFDDGSSIAATTYASGTRQTLTTNANGSLFSREVTIPKGIGSETSLYNGAGALQSITTRQGDDDGNTLVSVSTGAGTTTSAYDPGNNLISETFTPAGALSNFSNAQTATVFSDINSLLGAIRSGQPIPALASGVRLLSTLNPGDTSLGAANTVAAGVLSFYNLYNALNSGDGFAKVNATLSAINYANIALNASATGAFAAGSAAASLNTTLNGSGLAGGAPGILPALGLISAIKAGDPIGAAMSIGTLVQGSAFLTTNPVGWALIGVQILRSFMDKGPPDAWGTANVSFGPGITNYLSQVNATGENFGTERARGQLQGTLDALNSIIAQTNSSNPDSNQHLGIIPQRLPSLNYRASEFADKGYAVTDIDALTGAQRFHNIRFDDSGQVFNLDPNSITPELRAMLSLTGAPNYPQLNAYMLNSALDRQAIAPLWEVKTAKMQESAGDPNAGLTEEERAAKAGLGAAVDGAYVQSHPNDVNASKKRIGRFMPIGIDLDRNGSISTLSNAQTGVSFDWDGLGYQKQTGWIAGNDGFLLLDRNFNQSVDNATELLSNPLVADPAKGLRSLAAFDANADGRIDASDPVYAQLKVWQDLNQDGNNTHSLQTGPLTETAQEVLSVPAGAAGGRKEMSVGYSRFPGKAALLTLGALCAAANGFAQPREEAPLPRQVAPHLFRISGDRELPRALVVPAGRLAEYSLDRLATWSCGENMNPAALPHCARYFISRKPIPIKSLVLKDKATDRYGHSRYEVQLSDGQQLTVWTTDFGCSHSPDGASLSTGSIEDRLKNLTSQWGPQPYNNIAYNNMLYPSSAPYLQRTDAAGRVLWANVYLVRTTGHTEDKSANPAVKNPLLPFGELVCPKESGAAGFLTSAVIRQGQFSFGALAIEIDTVTGQPRTTHSRLRVVPATEVERHYRNALAELIAEGVITPADARLQTEPFRGVPPPSRFLSKDAEFSERLQRNLLNAYFTDKNQGKNK